jgi:hypothetical protein
MFGSNIELPHHRMLSYTSALAKYNSISPYKGPPRPERKATGQTL